MAITDKDIEKLSKVFATKKELNEVRVDLTFKIDNVKEELNGKIDNLRTELTDRILTSEDRIMKKLEDISIEQKMITAQTRRVDERLRVVEAKV